MVIWLFDAEVWHLIREKRDMGMSITDISKDMGISRPTVRKYLKGKKPPEYIKKNRGRTKTLNHGIPAIPW